LRERWTFRQCRRVLSVFVCTIGVYAVCLNHHSLNVIRWFRSVWRLRGGVFCSVDGFGEWCLITTVLAMCPRMSVTMVPTR
jgi:hypothetical protein